MEQNVLTFELGQILLIIILFMGDERGKKFLLELLTRPVSETYLDPVSAFLEHFLTHLNAESNLRVNHRDKTRVQMAAKMFPHLKLLC
jgi:hypothetical protein